MTSIGHGSTPSWLGGSGVRLLEAPELSPHAMTKHLTLEQLTACYRRFQSMLLMFDTALRLAESDMLSQEIRPAAGTLARSWPGVQEMRGC